MNVVTSATIFRDAVGLRMSITYSKIDSETGAVIKDNIRIDRVITDSMAKSNAEELLAYAQTFVDSKEE